MPTTTGKPSRQTKDDIAKLKIKFVEYFKDVPVQKYAAMAIGRTEETIIQWKTHDPEFLNAVEEAHAFWVQKNVIASKAEFQLERMEKAVFAQRSELTGAEGKDLPTPIYGGNSTVVDNSEENSNQ